MSILAKAAEIAATLDPTLGLELEQEFGDQWREKLAAEISGNTKSEIELDVQNLTQESFVKKYKKTDAISLAEKLGLSANGTEKVIVARIYKKLGE